MLSMLLPASVKLIADIPFSEVSDEQFDAAIQDLNLGHIDPDLRAAAQALLASKGIDNAAELIRSPGAIKQLMAFINGGLSRLASTKLVEEACEVCGGELVDQSIGENFFKVCAKCGAQH